MTRTSPPILGSCDSGDLRLDLPKLDDLSGREIRAVDAVSFIAVTDAAIRHSVKPSYQIAEEIFEIFRPYLRAPERKVVVIRAALQDAHEMMEWDYEQSSLALTAEPRKRSARAILKAKTALTEIEGGRS